MDVFTGGVITNCAISLMVGEANKAAKNFALDIPLPITESQLAERWFKCIKTDEPMITGHITLTNGWGFAFSEHGLMKFIDDSRTYFEMEEARRLPQMYGRMKLSKKQAAELVASRVRALGWPWLTNALSAKPTFEGGPVQEIKGEVPNVQIRWQPARGHMLMAEVDCDRARIISMFSSFTLSDPSKTNNFSCCSSFESFLPPSETKPNKSEP
jgi:hypothetical protein